MADGILALWVGFGFWWNYFDFVGGRVPRPGRTRVVWLNTHFLLALCISASGASMVSVVAHGADGRTSAANAWLLSATTAGILLSIAIIISTFDQRPGHANVSRMMIIAAVAALLVGAFRPAPWLFVLLLGFSVSVPWQESFTRHARLGLPFIPEKWEWSDLDAAAAKAHFADRLGEPLPDRQRRSLLSAPDHAIDLRRRNVPPML